MAENWYETARAGDRFGRGLKSLPFTVVDPWDGRRLRAYRRDVGAVWLFADDLHTCIPLHVENMRRHVAGLVRGTRYYLRLGGFGTVYIYADGYGVTLPSGGDLGHFDTPEQAAEALIPDGWTPPGGGA